MKDENKDMEELVQVVDKQLVTSSVTVARNFEKRHDHVIRDIEVYKIVSDASKLSCESLIQGFVYEANIGYVMDAMELEESGLGDAFCNANLICITKAYHSYTKIRFTLKKPYDLYPKHEYKGIIASLDRI